MGKSNTKGEQTKRIKEPVEKRKKNKKNLQKVIMIKRKLKKKLSRT